MSEMSEERIEQQLRQQQRTMWEVMDLVHKRRPDLYPDDGDVSYFFDPVAHAYKPGMSAEEFYAAALPELEAKARRDG